MHALRLAALLSVLTTGALTAAPTAEAQTARGNPREQGAAAGAGQAAPANNPVPQMQAQKFFPYGASWRAVSLNGKPFSGEPPYFTLDKSTRVQGFGGCNTFSTIAYALPTQRQQALAVGPINFTKKSCDAGTMASEKAFLAALRYGQQWDQQGSTLIIRGASGELRFERSF